MKKVEVAVPAGIRYISEWAKHQDNPFSIPDHPCIIDKGLTGCGFTEYCINPQYNNENIILCSPRRILLKNKHEQQTEQGNNVYIVRNDYEKILDVDKDLGSIKKTHTPGSNQSQQDLDDVVIDMPKEHHLKLKDGIRNYINECINFNQPAKILVTYDSFRIVREVVESDMNLLQHFRVVVDEFQSVFTDASFKADVGLEFVQDHLAGVQKLCYVSATPMMDEYLEELDEFKNLPLYVMDWKSLEPSRVIRPELKVSAFSGQSLMAVMDKVIETYKKGDFKQSSGVESKELVIYVNSVKNIRDIIRKSKLEPDQVNILCSDTPNNNKYLKKFLGAKYQIGSVPTKGEPRKMFTLCTRTVYLGADFYSDNARTVILSDSNIDCMSVDITLDLPQIMGRQRLDSNPWKNRAELYVKLLRESIDKDKFKELIERKDSDTEAALLAFSQIQTDHGKRVLLDKAIRDLKCNYKFDYLTVKRHSGGQPIPCVNILAKLAERRALDIQSMDYSDRFQLFNSISVDYDIDAESVTIYKFLDAFDKSDMINKYKLLCETGPTLSEEGLDILFKQIPTHFGEHYKHLGPDKIIATSYNTTLMNKYLHDVLNPFIPESIDVEIYSNFGEGQRYLLSEINDVLKIIYQNNDVKKTAVAVDLNNYFETKSILMTLPDKSRARGLKLIKRLR